MVELFVEDYPFGLRKIDDFESFDAAEKEMLDRYDSGMEEDFLIYDDGIKFVYPSYQLFKQECPRCGKETRPFQMIQTFDCHCIPFRKVCRKCYEKIMEIGYDGEKYGPEDENLDYDY